MTIAEKSMPTLHRKDDDEDQLVALLMVATHPRVSCSSSGLMDAFEVHIQTGYFCLFLVT
jgi:hypothetical protein